MWVKVKRIEKVENDNFLVYFDFLEREKFVVVTKKVLQFLKLKDFDNVKEMFVVKTFSRFNKPIYVIRKVKIGDVS